MTRTRLRIVVAGSMASAPETGGAPWAVIQYVVGLRRLGHEVVFLDTAGGTATAPPGASGVLESFRELSSRFGLDGQAALLQPGSRDCVGLSYMDLLRFSRTADLLLNLDGALHDPALLEAVPIRVRIALQGRTADESSAAFRGEVDTHHHHHFVTGITEGSGETRVAARPAPILQPVVLDEWPVDPRIRYHAFTAVDLGTWRALVGREPESYVSLPERARARFLLAVASEPSEAASLEALRRRGWAIVERSCVAGTPDSYRSFIQGSIAGFALAQNGTADPQGSWCGCAAACYLAAGRPILAEDTGFGGDLPAGEGILPFSSAGDVVDAIETLHARYRQHAQAARGVAESLFDSDRVLHLLLDRVGAAEPGEMSRPA